MGFETPSLCVSIQGEMYNFGPSFMEGLSYMFFFSHRSLGTTNYICTHKQTSTRIQHEIEPGIPPLHYFNFKTHLFVEIDFNSTKTLQINL